MNEQQYIIATNLAKANAILPILHSVMVGDEYGVNQKTYREAYKAIASMVDDLFKKNVIKG